MQPAPRMSSSAVAMLDVHVSLHYSTLLLNLTTYIIMMMCTSVCMGPINVIISKYNEMLYFNVYGISYVAIQLCVPNSNSHIVLLND